MKRADVRVAKTPSPFAIVALVGSILLRFDPVCTAASAEPVPLGSEFQVNTYTRWNQANASITRTNSGFMVVWESYTQDGAGYGVFGQRLGFNGGRINPEFQVNSHTSSGQGRLRITASANGAFVVVWSSSFQDGDGSGVFGQRYDSDAEPLGSEFQINTYTTHGQVRPDIGAAADGRFVVVWISSQQDGSGAGIFGQRYDGAGEPAGTEFRVNSITLGDQTFPEIAVSTAGDFIVTWSREGGTSGANTIFARRFSSAGIPVGNDFVVNESTRFNKSDPDVALDMRGNFVVVWSSYLRDGSQHGVFGRRFLSSGAPTGTEFQVNTYTTGNQSDAILATDFARVAMEADGRFIVVWNSFGQDGSFDGIFGQRFASDGARAGTEFQVNTYTVDQQIDPSVAFGNGGEFLVLWSTATAFGGADVHGQRFGEASPSPTPSPTASATAVPPQACPATPLPSCIVAPRSVFVIKDREADGASVKDRILWKWLDGPAAAQSSFGSPTTTTAYRFCVYTGLSSQLTMRAEIPPAGVCGGTPCWKPIDARGYKRVDIASATAGISKVSLQGHLTRDRSAIVVRGIGTLLDIRDDTLPMNTAANLVVQMSTDDATPCWQSMFSATDTKTNSESLYRARNQ